jgi:ABC-type branched-subunit amino acid transport system substrate-binding protein
MSRGIGNREPGTENSQLSVLGSLFPILLAFACGPKVAPSWQEQEAHESHETTQVHATGSGAAFDPAHIDELDEATVLGALAQAGDAAPAARLALRAARLAHHRGDDADARALVARAASAADEASVHAELVALGKDLGTAAIDPVTVAVLLPLSGRFSGIGSELRVAIELARDGEVKWLFLDTKGEPDGAVAAVELAAQKGALAIMGPVGTRETLAAARAASLRQIPIALLAPEDGADPASGVYRLVGSPADEGRAVAELAKQDSFPTVAVFAPRDDVGAEAAEAFVAEAQRQGLTVAGQGSYDPTGGDVEPDVKQFLNLVPATNPRLAAHLAKKGKKGWQTFSPDIPFSLLYIPDRYDRAAIVAAFLPYYGVELRTTDFPDLAQLKRKHGGRVPQVVQLVGGAGWHHPSLPVRGGSAVQGALIVDSFAGDLGGDAGGAFANAFQERAGRSPSSAAAEVFDAATLVARARHAAAANPSDPRGAFRAYLARAKLDDGACGEAGMDVDGELVRTPLLLEVQGEELIVAP